MTDHTLPPVEYRNRTSKIDMTFFVHQYREDVYANIEYYTGIFRKETVQRMASHFKNVIKAVVIKPSIKLKDIEIISTEEKRQTLYEFNRTVAEFPGDKTIHQLFEEQVSLTPDAVALVGLDVEEMVEGTIPMQHVHSFSYRQLNEKADCLAAYLYYDIRIRPEERVGILVSGALDSAISILGVLKAGGAYVPFDPSLPGKRLKYMINDAFISVVISEKKYIKTLNRLQWECRGFHSYLCLDSIDVHREVEVEGSRFMDKELWDHIGESATDEITGGGWSSSYTGEPFSKAEMSEYGDNVLEKLRPLLKQDTRVLEVGCASGITMYRIAPLVGYYHGTDLSEVMIRKNRERLEAEGHTNIDLTCVAAHRLESLEEADYDIVIINSVIQAFPGHNHLRKVIHQCIDKLADRGYLFIGDVMDQDLKEVLVTEIFAFRDANQGRGYKTKTDFSDEFFISRYFFEDLSVEDSRINEINFSSKLYTIENELTKFRYDVLLTVDKHTQRKGTGNINVKSKHKYQHDMRWLESYGSSVLASVDTIPGQLAYIIYTSGSTGTPKAVAVENRGLVNYVCWRISAYDLNEIDITLQLLSSSFDGFGANFYSPLVSGGQLVMMDSEMLRDYDGIVKIVGRQLVSTFSLVPGMYGLLFETGEGVGFHSLRLVVFGGEKADGDLIERSQQRYPGVCLVNEYGPTEATVAVVANLELSASNPGIIGRPLANTNIYILNRFLKLQPVGVPGELCIQGTGVARGYLNNPEFTAEKFDYDLKDWKDGQNFKKEKKETSAFSAVQTIKLYNTGDLAKWLPDGNIEFLGRIDQQVKIRGFRVEVKEIETQLLNHSGIKEVVVVAKAEEIGDKYLCAYVVPVAVAPDIGDSASSTEKLTVPELRHDLSLSLPDYMIPSYFISLRQIPLTPNGKVDRKALPEPKVEAGDDYVAPRDPVENQLVVLWSKVLGIEPSNIGIEDNFFDLGGHSLKATIIVSKIHKALNVKVPLTEVFRTPTIRQLAQYIHAADRERYASIEPAEKKEYYGLSAAQKRLYILYQMDLESTAYNMPQFIPLRQTSSMEKLEEAFIKLIDRHESLRTSFHMLDTQPVQKVHDHVEFSIEIREESLERRTPQSFVRPFDLSQAPLLRVELTKAGEGNHILAVDMHHTISDGVSMAVLERDFIASYEGNTIPPLRLQYKDFSQWQSSESEQKNIANQEAYWLDTFEGEIPVLQLPIDYQRPVVQSFEGNHLNFQLSVEDSRGLRAIALETGSTVFMVLLSLTTIFLSKLSGQDDIVIGTPIAGRRHADLEKVIGMFVNTLALRNYPIGRKTVKEFIEGVKKQTLSAFENQEYQFEDLVEQLPIDRNTGRNPLFDVMFSLLVIEQERMVNSAGDSIPGDTVKKNVVSDAGTGIRNYDYERRNSKFDLTVTAVDLAHTIQIGFTYCAALFRVETIQRFIAYFKRVISQYLQEPQKKLRDMEIIGEEEKHRLLYTFNDTRSDYPEDKSIPRLFKEQVERTPDRIAAVSGMSITYGELNHQSSGFACLLNQKGIGPDTIVALMTDRTIDTVIGILGILKVGGAYLPIAPDYPMERKSFMLNDSNVNILVLSKEVEQLNHSVVKPDLQKIFIDSPGQTDKSTSHPPGDPVKPASDKPAYVIYTSGTTGRPKGVLVEHRNAVNTVTWLGRAYDLKPGTHVLLMSDYIFDPSVNQVFGSFLHGAKLHITDKSLMMNTSLLRQYIERHQINIVNFVPMLFKELLGQGPKLNSIQVVLSGGERLDDSIKEKIIKKGYALYNQYGPTETTIDALVEKCSQEKVTLGTPISNTRCYILSKYHYLVPIGIAGELYIGGSGVARGYLNNPDLTDQRFIRLNPQTLNYKLNSLPKPRIKKQKALGGVTSGQNFSPDARLYKTGDLTRWLTNGTIEFMGRLDSQVKIRGYRIELGEIENWLLKYPGVLEAVLVTGEDNSGDKYICAYVVPDKELVLSNLRDYLLKNIPDYMEPSY
ncbi:MAG: amino acid adenylation domain-containing protein, partial [bacterium]|nr:amino acid adenylation domain-containing protein [bacterium]